MASREKLTFSTSAFFSSDSTFLARSAVSVPSWLAFFSRWAWETDGVF